MIRQLCYSGSSNNLKPKDPISYYNIIIHNITTVRGSDKYTFLEAGKEFIFKQKYN